MRPTALTFRILLLFRAEPRIFGSFRVITSSQTNRESPAVLAEKVPRSQESHTGKRRWRTIATPRNGSRSQWVRTTAPCEWRIVCPCLVGVVRRPVELIRGRYCIPGSLRSLRTTHVAILALVLAERMSNTVAVVFSATAAGAASLDGHPSAVV